MTTRKLLWYRRLECLVFKHQWQDFAHKQAEDPAHWVVGTQRCSNCEKVRRVP